jgi:hypothetical protein
MECLLHGAELVKDAFFGISSWNGWTRIINMGATEKPEEGSVDLTTAKKSLADVKAEKV